MLLCIGSNQETSPNKKKRALSAFHKTFYFQEIANKTATLNKVKYMLTDSKNIIYKALDGIIDNFQFNSVRQVSEGVSKFQKYGRGAFCIQFNSVNALLNSTMFRPTFYPLSEMYISFPEWYEICVQYDPTQSVVFMVLVTISKKLSSKGYNDSLGLSRVFFKDSYKDIKPVHDKNGLVIQNTLLQLAQPADSLSNRPQCQVCQKVTRCHTCVKCKLVNYCGEKCQRMDWPTHKLQCKALARVRTKIRQDFRAASLPTVYE
jgi:hypothetical protein